jgi:hypothetical protein
MDLFKSPRQELDPLDMEILERAFDAALAVVKEDHPTEFDRMKAWRPSFAASSSRSLASTV